MLQQSRASSLKEHLKSTRTSAFTLALGREARPSWGNRFLKDFNDLHYDFAIDRFSNSNKFINSQLLQSDRIKSDLKGTDRSKKKLNPEDSLGNSQGRGAKRGLNLNLSLHQPERIEISTLDNCGQRHSGLCPFQYGSTIEGKIEKRSSHHLSFSYDKVQRINNQNPVYYDRSSYVDLSHSQQLTQRKQLEHYHPFRSYLDRRVFEPRDELDKFYDSDSARRAASPRRVQPAVRQFDRVLERKDPSLPQSAGLAYDLAGCMDRLKHKPESYSIRPGARETILGREVIDPKRGCRR